MKQKITAVDKATLPQMGLKHGASIYVGNKDVTITSLIQKEQEPAKVEQKTTMIDTTSKLVTPKVEEKKEKVATKEQEKGLDKLIKHVPFDSYVKEMRKRCAHPSGNSKCQYCTWNTEQSFKVNYNCKNHLPYPTGSCGKCYPPAICLNQQKYRHVDYLSFMNKTEVGKFIGFW